LKGSAGKWTNIGGGVSGDVIGEGGEGSDAGSGTGAAWVLAQALAAERTVEMVTAEGAMAVGVVLRVGLILIQILIQVLSS
jgi:hypothetical protein